MLGAIFAILSAASFALNTAMARRGVVSGTPIQAMAVTVPLGVVCLLPLTFLTGDLLRLPQFPITATAWMAAVGVVHFIIGRYCNFRSNALAGVNLTAPVVQLQVVVTMIMAVVVLHEPCTALQMIGGALIIAGSVITQQAPARTAATDPAKPDAAAVRAPLPRGLSVRLARRRLLWLDAGDGAVCAGEYRSVDRHPGRADLLRCGNGGGGAGLGLPAIRNNVCSMTQTNARWFAASGVFVAAAQGFFFMGVAVAPVMLVMPLLQFSLVFRMLFSTWLNPAHEIVGPLVLARRRDIGRRRLDGVDRDEPDRRRARSAGAAGPCPAVAGVAHDVAWSRTRSRSTCWCSAPAPAA